MSLYIYDEVCLQSGVWWYQIYCVKDMNAEWSTVLEFTYPTRLLKTNIQQVLDQQQMEDDEKLFRHLE